MKKTVFIFVLGILPFLLTGCDYTVPLKNKISVKPPVIKNSPQVTIIDDNWKQYLNNDFNYSIKIPSSYFIKDGECIQDTAGFNYKVAPTNTLVLEKANYAYIIPEFRYAIENNKCDKVIPNVNELSKNSLVAADGWVIHAFNANDTNEVDTEIKKQFGDKCSLEVLKPTNNPQVFDVVISKNEQCQINFSYFFKYDDKSKTGVSINLGESFTFNRDESSVGTPYDEEMLNSFTFIN